MTAAAGLLERPASTDVAPSPTPPSAPARPDAADAADAVDLDALASSVLATAKGTMVACRAATRLARSADVRVDRSVVALMHHQRLDDHACSSGATLTILRGRVVLVLGGSRRLLHRGETVSVPPTTHAVQAVGDAVLLITTHVDPRGGPPRPFVA